MAISKPIISEKLVKYHIVAGLTAFGVALFWGYFYSFQFVQHYFFPGIEFFSPGRMRMVHTNLVAYGFIANIFIAGLHWVVPRLTGKPQASEKLGWFIFYAWQFVLLSTFVGIHIGLAQGVEWGETPIFIDPVIVLGLGLVAYNFLDPILKTEEKSLYVSNWYFISAFVWTLMTVIMGNYLPQWFIPGAAGAAVTGLFIHDLVGLFVTPLGWGMMYYFVPTIIKKPVWSHALSLIGFWGLAFFYPLNGVHHYLWSPIPMYVQYGAVTATVAVEIVVTTVVVNFFATLWKRGEYLRTNLPIRWFYTGMIFYFTTCLQCSFQVLLTVQEIIHFTDWVVGHAHLVMFGVFGFWLLGIVVELWPKLVKKNWYSDRLNQWHYWLTAMGMVIMFWDLLVAGLVQGFTWKSLVPWEESILLSIPFWWVRSFSGTMIIIGSLCLFWNMYKTAKQPETAKSGNETVTATA